jgi:hypothetical protein
LEVLLPFVLLLAEEQMVSDETLVLIYSFASERALDIHSSTLYS